MFRIFTVGGLGVGSVRSTINMTPEKLAVIILKFEQFCFP